ncbi:MAG: PIN domain-containing protein [Enterobacterales bacterium]|nr:PIN domain-containing protein [Enterobacterales bacterium]
MDVLIDSSVWIDYFRGGNKSSELERLIDENLIVINDIILAELIPYLKIKKQITVIKLLHKIKRLPLLIDWEELIDNQVNCLNGGANGIGIPDLIIAQNAKMNNCMVFSLDKHFQLLSRFINIKLY